MPRCDVDEPLQMRRGAEFRHTPRTFFASFSRFSSAKEGFGAFRIFRRRHRRADSSVLRRRYFAHD